LTVVFGVVVEVLVVLVLVLVLSWGCGLVLVGELERGSSHENPRCKKAVLQLHERT